MTRRGWHLFPFQEEVARAYLAGESGLVHAATGTGKTLAAWLGPLWEGLLESQTGARALEDPSSGPASDAVPQSQRRSGMTGRGMSPGKVSGRRTPDPLRVLWLTPLRALAADTAAALEEPLAATGLPWSIETRTGDTTAAERARQNRRLPTVLVTTPESLSLLLTRDDAGNLFDDLRLVVVDEWHELMGSKRGVLVELGLARLRALRPDLRTWALSATLGNLDEALETLLGPDPGLPTSPLTPGESRSSATAESPGPAESVGSRAASGSRRAHGRIVRGVSPKLVIVDSLIPPTLERFPWAGHLGTQMLPQVVAAIDEGDTAIVFTNTRSQTELWFQAILEARPDWAGIVALHHGSLDPENRAWVERGLRAGTLRCVVATSSLDLGVDFSPVDRVLQVGSPKGVARLLQRAGRSGHRPGAVSRITCVPTMALELIEVAAARDGIDAGAMEARYPVHRPLDVLVQHLVTVAMGGGFEPDAMLAEVRATRAFEGLTDAEWEWAIDFVTRGGDALRAYPEYSRVVSRDGRLVVEDPHIARRHRMSIGTIVDDAQISVVFLNGKRLGSVEEQFISRLRPGDRFIFAGRALEFVRVRDMKAWVRLATSSKGAVPRWMGARLPLSGALASALRHRLEEASKGLYRGPEMEAVRPILEVQARWSAIPAADQLLIEAVRTREGHHLFIFPFEGRLVHQGLAALFAYRIARLAPITFSLAANDWGFELLSPTEAPIEEALARGLLSPHDLVDDIPASLNATEMARRQFREIARVAGLVFPGYPRSGKSARQLQASSGLFFDVFARYDPDNPLVGQAHREVLERQLESSRIGRTLERLVDARALLTRPKRTPPFAFPLLVDRTRERVSSESMGDRIRRMQLALERAAG